MHILKLTGPRLEILKDAKGPYGIGFVGNCRQLLACYTDDYTLPKLVLRPDRLDECSIGMGIQPVLQRILPSGIFRHAVEMKLFRALHRAMLIRAGFEKPRRQETQDWWSDNPVQQAKNRRTYHGLKRSALYITNGLVAELLETVADKEALRVARRYPLAYRGPIYSAAARSSRACQLTETFPLLAIMAYGGGKPPDGIGEVRESIEEGRPLRDIADYAAIPMALTKIGPGAADDIKVWQIELFKEWPNLIHSYLPPAIPAQRRWLRAINAAQPLGLPFVEWTAKHASLGMGRTLMEADSFVTDLSDWVRASYRASVPDHVLNVIQEGSNGYQANILNRGGRRFVARQFSPDMSLGTVLALSNEWHEAVADSGEIEGGNFEFPPQWLADGEADGYQIKAITNNADLYREGRKMHNCVGTYSSEVKDGRLYIYSVSKDGEKVATFELHRGNDSKILFGQMRGKQNSQADPAATTAARKWLANRKRIQGDAAPEIEYDPAWTPGNNPPDPLGDQIPF